MMTPTLTPFQAAVEALRLRGIVLRQLSAEYSVNFHKGAAATEYRTDELADALAHGLAMGAAPVLEPPLGPMGHGMTRRGAMYRHNRKLAAKRALQQSGAAAAHKPCVAKKINGALRKKTIKLDLTNGNDCSKQ